MRLPIDTVLLPIDVQRAIDDPCWGPRNNPGAEERIAALLAAWRGSGMPVIHVRHDSVEPTSPYRPEQPLHDFKPEAEPAEGEPVVAKRTGSAFVDTDLEPLLTEGGHTTLVICGVLTHNSVATTVRHAGCLGYRVFVAADACWAVDVTDSAGRHWPAEDVHAQTLATLAGEYAGVTDAQAAIGAAMLAAGMARWKQARVAARLAAGDQAITVTS
jgi:nicotinamidase-related amidase